MEEDFSTKLENWKQCWNFTNVCLHFLNKPTVQGTFGPEYVTLTWKGHRIFRCIFEMGWEEKVHGALITFQYMISSFTGGLFNEIQVTEPKQFEELHRKLELYDK